MKQVLFLLIGVVLVLGGCAKVNDGMGNKQMDLITQAENLQTGLKPYLEDENMAELYSIQDLNIAIVDGEEPVEKVTVAYDATNTVQDALMQQIKGNWLKYTDKQKDSLKALFKDYKKASFQTSLFLDCEGLKLRKTGQNIHLGEIILTTKEVSLIGKG